MKSLKKKVAVRWARKFTKPFCEEYWINVPEARGPETNQESFPEQMAKLAATYYWFEFGDAADKENRAAVKQAASEFTKEWLLKNQDKLK